MKKKELTLSKTEFQLMTILWDMGHAACAWDILERWEEPKPAYTTIATYLKVLYEKGFLDYFKNKGEGKTHQYLPKVTRAEYTRQVMHEVKKNYFDGSIKKILSFFMREEHLTEEEMMELMEELRTENDGTVSCI